MVSLQIYVVEHCPNCDYAWELAREVAAAFPKVHLEVVDLEKPGVERPEAVFATPTYLLNGRVAWLGNPGREHLFQRLCAALDSEAKAVALGGVG
jgi:hypothetical protein